MEGYAKSKLAQVNEKIAETVVEGYRKIEDGVVGGFTKMTDKIVETFRGREEESAGNGEEE
ncbi:MAG: hypothetical protein IJ466_08485 [Clostridia bacterium]|nr:hypothetical protein [Clostridia bacterium]